MFRLMIVDKHRSAEKLNNNNNNNAGRTNNKNGME